MKFEIFLIMIIFTLGYAYSSVTIIPGPGQKNKIFIVNKDGEDIQKIIWIFPGFQAESDPYRQNPVWIIRYWELEKISGRIHAMIILPDIPGTVYPLYEKGTTKIHPDMLWLSGIHRGIINKYGLSARIIFSGISTGVEGVLKFASIITNRAEIIAISGTFDYSKLDKFSGEYRIHLKQFGGDKESWHNENPVEIIKKFDRLKIYLFCEEKSVYSTQAKNLTQNNPDNVEIINFLDLGTDQIHGWKFWKRESVLNKLEDIFMGI